MGYLSVEGVLNLLPFSSLFHSILGSSYTILSATLNGNEDLLKIGPQNYKHDISPISSYYMPPIIYFMALQSNRKSVKIYNHFLLLSLLSLYTAFCFSHHMWSWWQKTEHCNVNIKPGLNWETIFIWINFAQYVSFLCLKPSHIFLSMPKKDNKREPINNLVSCYSSKDFMAFIETYFLLIIFTPTKILRHLLW